MRLVRHTKTQSANSHTVVPQHKSIQIPLGSACTPCSCIGMGHEFLHRIGARILPPSWGTNSSMGWGHQFLHQNGARIIVSDLGTHSKRTHQVHSSSTRRCLHTHTWSVFVTSSRCLLENRGKWKKSAENNPLHPPTFFLISLRPSKTCKYVYSYCFATPFNAYSYCF